MAKLHEGSEGVDDNETLTAAPVTPKKGEKDQVVEGDLQDAHDKIEALNLDK